MSQGKAFQKVKQLLILLCGLLLIGPGAAQAMDPYARPDASWISLGGTVTSISPRSFVLDYGPGRITVEMDSTREGAKAYALIPGDKVRVGGHIDDDLFEKTTIEAGTIYVERLGTYFRIDSKDERNFLDLFTPQVLDPAAVVQGVVTKVDDKSFTLDAGALVTLDVDVSGMAGNPLDNVGIPKVGVGDYVRVSGKLTDGFFSGRELKAEWVIKLVE